MSVLRIAWSVLVGATACLGATGALVTPPLALLVGFSLGAALGGVLHPRDADGRRIRIDDPERRRGRAAWPPVASVLVGATAGLALAGLFTVLGLAALAFLAAIAAGGLLLPGGARTRPVPDGSLGLGPGSAGPDERTGDAARGGPRPAAVRVPPEHLPSPSEITQWSTERLCRAWRISYLWLERAREARDAALTARLTAVRQALLDELHGRAPSGFAAWLASGARAASDPGRYVAGARSGVRGPSGARGDPDRPGASGADGLADARQRSSRKRNENS